MEDEGILSFIQTLEEDEAKNDIYEELEELKNILNRKRLNNYKKNMEDDRAMK